MLDRFIRSVAYNRSMAMIYFIAAIMLCLTVIIAFTGLSSYSILADETYQALCCKDYQNSPLAMMIFYIGNKWMALFGDDLLSLRILSRLCILIAIGIGGGYLWKKTNNILLTSAICMLSATFANLGDMSFYNWDTGAYPVAALGTLVLLLYIDRASLLRLMILGFLTGVMTAFRVPLIAFMGIIAIVLIVENGILAAIKPFALYTLMVIIGLSASAVLMTGSIQCYIDSFNPDNIISGHTGNVLRPYCIQFIGFFPRNIFCGMVTFTPILLMIILSFLPKRRLVDYLSCQIIVLVIGFSCVLEYAYSDNAMLSGIGIPFFLVIVGWLYLSKRLWGYTVENPVMLRTGKLKLLVLLMSMLLLGLGSDTAFQRWNIIAYFPMSIAVVWSLIHGKPKILLKTIILTSMPVLVLMVPFKSCWIKQSSEFLNVPRSSKYYGLCVPNELIRRYDAINNLVKRLNEKGISYTFGGPRDRFLYSYEFERNNRLVFPLHVFHWKEGDENMLKHYERKSDVVILVPFTSADSELLKRLYNLEIIEETPSYTVCGDKKLKEVINPDI